jgi:hypothetical protein
MKALHSSTNITFFQVVLTAPHSLAIIMIFARILLQLILIRIVYAANFHIHCTLTPAGSNFVTGPDRRSTLSILWSSLLTVFLCTWTVQHLSLPPPMDKNHGILQRVWQFLCRKPKWMLITMILPEFLVSRALGDFVAAYLSANRCNFLQEHVKRSHTQWTTTHAFYANMGGFVLKDRNAKRGSSSHENEIAKLSTSLAVRELPAESIKPGPPYSTLDISPMGCCRLHDPKVWTEEYYQYADEYLDFNLPISVNSAQLCILMRTGLIEQLPCISKQEIKDKSKENLAVMLFALLQVLWLFSQLIDRKVNGLPSTQLKIAVLSFAICAFIAYLFWLRKPKMSI